MTKVLMFAKGIENKKLNKLGQNVVHMAAQANKPEILKILLDNEMYCIPDAKKMHPAHFAALNGGLETLKLILGNEDFKKKNMANI
jgi:hypothetical protein